MGRHHPQLDSFTRINDPFRNSSADSALLSCSTLPDAYGKSPRVAGCSLLSWKAGCRGKVSLIFWLRPSCLPLPSTWRQLGLSQVMGKESMPYPAPELRSWNSSHLQQLLLLKFPRLRLVGTWSLGSPCRLSSFLFTMALCRKGAVLSSFPVGGSGEGGQISVSVS